MFGLGMNNNGSGMVLAASALVAAPWAIVPVLAYNLVQHIIAAGIRPARPKRLSVIAQPI
jgi:BASS family bile acid:Na+ symporter